MDYSVCLRQVCTLRKVRGALFIQMIRGDSMYQVLYRKYRPKIFSDVYGQDHVTSTLRNEIKNDRISHAYLFTGSRGTGKTTCAKILAKAVNCEHPHDGEPCNECEVCRGLDDGSIYDIVEIDAASNRRVDDVRELREATNYTPSRGKYRVYIIDEVHMLTNEAFNALLKTLEEPPAHVIFILATTDVHKIPPTILSRCQRFDFKRIQPETMAVRLQEVSRLEGITLDDDAAVLIARIADGALRDGLSILDQCAGRSKSVTTELVSEVAGLAGKEALYQLSRCIAEKNSSEAMNVISSLYQNSYDMERLCVEMMNHFRNFLVVKTVPKSRPLIVCTDDEYNTIVSAADEYTIENIIFSLDLFQETLIKIKGGATARIEVEMAFIKLCEPKLDASNAALLDRLSNLERAVRNGVMVPTKTAPAAAIPRPEKEVKDSALSAPDIKEDSEEDDLPPFDADIPSTQTESAPAPETPSASTEKTPPQPTPQEESDGYVPFTQWGEFIDEIKKSDISLFSVLNGAGAFLQGDRFMIDSPNPTIRDFIKMDNRSRKIKQALYNVTGKKYRLFIMKQDQSERPKRDPLEDLISQAQGKINIDLK